jgi:hypothetical protein
VIYEIPAEVGAGIVWVAPEVATVLTTSVTKPEASPCTPVAGSCSVVKKALSTVPQVPLFPPTVGNGFAIYLYKF